MEHKLYRVIGLMSGTSIDGIDAALIETDGYNHVRPLGFIPNPYEKSFRSRLRKTFGNREGSQDREVAAVEHELTLMHAHIVEKCKDKLNAHGEPIDLIGFHGQTILHQPAQKISLQLGDGALLAKMTQIPVINDFRSQDVLAGGHGAPLVPLYHRALVSKLPKPVAILNIGGVSNITWIKGEQDTDLMAFDVGPGNALIDDWIMHHTGSPYDEYGLLASTGRVDQKFIDAILEKPFFLQKPPKSLDRDEFQNIIPHTMSVTDGAATLTMLTACSVTIGLTFIPSKPHHLYVTGGGRLNHTLMRWIAGLTDIPVSPVDDLGWSGDGLEAEAFAYLAVRSLLGLPLSVPTTTGVPRPITGGRLHLPS